MTMKRWFGDRSGSDGFLMGSTFMAGLVCLIDASAWWHYLPAALLLGLSFGWVVYPFFGAAELNPAVEKEPVCPMCISGSGILKMHITDKIIDCPLCKDALRGKHAPWAGEK